MRFKKMNKNILRSVAFFIGGLSILSFSGVAQADSIGGLGSSCATCQGATYTLSYSGSPIAFGGGLETFRITLEIDTSTYSGGGGFIDAVAIKVSPQVNSASLFAAPGGVGDWSIVAGGINASGCSGAGGGFSCADFMAVGQGAAVGGLLSWTFDETISAGTLFTGVNEASIKARYVNNAGNKVGALVSENITLQAIPEPSTVLLIGSGLIGLGFWRWKKAG